MATGRLRLFIAAALLCSASLFPSILSSSFSSSSSSSLVSASSSLEEVPHLTAHIIAHSHCDPGWLESFEGYYSSQVHTILTSVMSALDADPNRKFIWAEMSFWMRWYEVQNEDMKQLVQKLVREGRIEFIGGGWVQNDEANPDPAAIISQITEGNEYLMSLFGVRPRIAWQIDPFGHSAAMSAIASSAGYDALVINRIEHTVKDSLKQRAAMEFIWEPYSSSPVTSTNSFDSAVQGKEKDTISTAGTLPASLYGNASIFTHVLHTHYSAPRGYDFENPEGFPVGDHNVGARASGLVSELRSRARAYRTTHLLVPFGDDFKFQNAHHQFQNMDRLIRHVNARNGRNDDEDEYKDPQGDENAPKPAPMGVEPDFAGVRLRYSTLSDYFDAVFAEARRFVAESASSTTEEDTDGDGIAESTVSTSNRVKEVSVIPFPRFGPQSMSDGGADFFPYADNQHSFWTGYYVSRTQLKGAIRRTTAFLRSTDALFSVIRPWAGVWQEAAGTALSTYVNKQLNDDVEGGGGGGEEEGSEAFVPSGRSTEERTALSSVPYATFSWMRAFQRMEQVRLDAALCLHHDAITGTSRESVVHDYTRRMREGHDDAATLVADLASLMLGGLPKTLKQQGGNSANNFDFAGQTLAPAPLTYVPHVLPVQTSVRISASLNADGSGSSGGGGGSGGAASSFYSIISSDIPAHPIVTYNPTAWRRKTTVHVMVDVGSDARSPVALAETNAEDAGNTKRKTKSSSSVHGCRGAQWPYAIVTDNEGRVIPSQWTAIVEAQQAASDIYAGAKNAGERQSGRAAVGEDAHGRPLGHTFSENSSPETATPAWAANNVRYELVFLVDLPPLSLSTYFVTTAWRAGTMAATTEEIEQGACGAQDDVLRTLGAMGTSTAVVVPGLTVKEYAPQSASAAAAVTVGEEVMQERLVSTSLNYASSRHSTKRSSSSSSSTAPLILENGCLRLEINPATGTLSAVTRKFAGSSDSTSSDNDAEEEAKSARVKVEQKFGAYQTRQSGAYIFRPLEDAREISHPSSSDGGPANEVTVSVSVAPHGDLFDTENSPADAQRHAGGALSSSVRVVSSVWSQTIRLVDTIGWYSGASASASMCEDPLLLDSSFEVIPTITASGNTEVVMILETSIDVLGDETMRKTRAFTNPRDNFQGAPQGSGGEDDGKSDDDDGSGSSTTCGPAIPVGWWTSDGLGLLRRAPATSNVPAADHTKYFYPLNTLTRISGKISSPDSEGDGKQTEKSSAGEGGHTAWLSIFTQQPFGVMVKETNNGGSRMEVMLHRHLNQDDGRGLSSPVSDSTRLTPRLLFTMGAQCVGENVNTPNQDSQSVAAQKSKSRSGKASAITSTTTTSTTKNALHADWQWTWATRSALFVHNVVILHADLDSDSIRGDDVNYYSNLKKKRSAAAAARQEENAGSTNENRDTLKPKEFLHIIPPIDASQSLGIREEPVALAESPIPRSVWTERFETKFTALSSTIVDGVGSSTLPPWIHMLTMATRDAVSDDILFRLQNVGGPTTEVDVRTLLDTRPRKTSKSRSSLSSSSPSSSSSSLAGLKITSLRPRTLTFNRDAFEAARHPVGVPRTLSKAATRAVKEYPLAGAPMLKIMRTADDEVRRAVANALGMSGSRHASSLLGGGESLDANAAARQNTDEEGVFLSDAALAKVEQDNAEAAAAGSSSSNIDNKNNDAPSSPFVNNEEQKPSPPPPPPFFPEMVEKSPEPGKIPAYHPPRGLPKGGQGMRNLENTRPGLPPGQHPAMEGATPPEGFSFGDMTGNTNQNNKKKNISKKKSFGRALIEVDAAASTASRRWSVVLPPSSIGSFLTSLEAPQSSSLPSSLTQSSRGGKKKNVNTPPTVSKPKQNDDWSDLEKGVVESDDSPRRREQQQPQQEEEVDNQPQVEEIEKQGSLQDTITSGSGGGSGGSAAAEGGGGEGEDEATSSQDSIARREAFIAMIDYVTISAKEKERMRATVLSGKELTAVDQRRLITASRVASRAHNQPQPENWNALVAKWLDFRRRGSSGNGENGEDEQQKQGGEGGTQDAPEDSGPSDETSEEENDSTNSNDEKKDKKDFPEDPWAKNFLASESRDFFDEMRKPRTARVDHDTADAPAVAVEFLNEDVGSNDTLISLLFSLAAWGAFVLCAAVFMVYRWRTNANKQGGRGGGSNSSSGSRGNASTILPTTSITRGKNNAQDSATGGWLSWNTFKRAAYPTKMI